jgi:hypothetical protein
MLLDRAFFSTFRDLIVGFFSPSGFGTARLGHFSFDAGQCWVGRFLRISGFVAIHEANVMPSDVNVCPVRHTSNKRPDYESRSHFRGT